jgi:hypothetical protein
VDKTVSLADFLKLVNYATNQYKKEAYALPEEGFEVQHADQQLQDHAGAGDVSAFHGSGYETGQYTASNPYLRFKGFSGVETKRSTIF